MAKTFNEFTYRRPDMAALGQQMEARIAQFAAAASFAEAETALEGIYQLRSDFDTQYNLAYVRHTADTRDAFYEAENAFFDENLPVFEQYKSLFYRALLDTPWRSDLEHKHGRQLFDIAELRLKTFHPDIIADLQTENQLASAYNKLKATAQIAFQVETYNLSSIQPWEENPDRDLRAAAAFAKWDWMAEHQTEIEDLFDQLVKVRHRIAQQLGFQNFVELGYARMLRTDYNATDVAYFREGIRQHIVPLAKDLYARQAERLGLEALHFYDEAVRNPSGNPQPKGDPQWIIEQAATMYHELSPETDAFFQFMQDGQLMDLVSRDGKSTGGYCTYLPGEQAPFIFSNFNGTSGDIDVLTHEAGHAFQVYSSRYLTIEEYHWPTYEAAEIHSMSMEFFTWPWMANFFGDQVAQYRYGHLEGAAYFLPYGVAVDEFQHYVYEHPDHSPAQRNAAWRAIEQKYLPQRDYQGHPLLESGGFWQKQSHIFASPFYYIDYTLAQVCAFQFWLKDQTDHTQAWADYVRLCQAGGSRSFLGLVALANLKSPFAPGCIDEVATAVRNWLQQNAAHN